MQIPPEIVAETLERTDLVALVSRHVDLKQRGRTYLGLCPFHAEKTPSFNVNPQRRFFKCFGCDAGGDAITFLKRISGRGFAEVVHELAREAGVTIVERDDPTVAIRRALHEANAFAARHFQQRLWDDPRGRAGRDHLVQRGVRPELARRFGLGYAPNSWSDLTDALAREGIVEGALGAGLCSPKRSGEGHFDAFRGRLMIPIRSLSGHTIAFGARQVEIDGPKYLNSKESPVYRKSDTLFGLDVAQETIRREKRAILVEGYFDVMGLHAAGILNSVALCSTALTPGHLTALQRAEAKELVMLLDGDAAGQRAIERLAGPLLASGLSVRVATLPEGDPDTFALRYGKEATDALIAEAPPLSAHLLRALLPGGRTAPFEAKMAAFERVRALLAPVPGGLTRTLLIQEIGDHFGLTEADVREALFSPRAPTRKPAAPPQATVDPQEHFLAALLIVDPSLRALPEASVLDELQSIPLRLLVEAELPEEAIAALPPADRALFDAKRAEIARTLSGDDQADARKRALTQLATRIRLMAVETQIDRRTAELKTLASSDTAPGAEVEELQTELKQLLEERMRFRRGSPRA